MGLAKSQKRFRGDIESTNDVSSSKFKGLFVEQLHLDG
jgi:hypothetical protein